MYPTTRPTQLCSRVVLAAAVNLDCNIYRIGVLAILWALVARDRGEPLHLRTRRTSDAGWLTNPDLSYISVPSSRIAYVEL